MDLQHLDKNQLKAFFLNINAQYLKTIDAPIGSYINSPDFIKLRKQLQEIMEELDKRRSMDPPVLHERSPQGIEPDTFFNGATFLSDM
jgi:hypothetical protein